MDVGDQLAFELGNDAPDALVVRESARARRMSLQAVPHRGVELVAPTGTPANLIEAFASRHRVWIERQSARIEKEFPAAARALPDSIELAALGRRWSVHYDIRRADGREITERTDRLELCCARGAEDAGRSLLRDWLRSLGKRRLVPALERAGRATGLPFRRAQVRGQRTRWGSYSNSGTISLNYCLLFLSPDLVRYLFLHELCHSVHMNHSRAFWALVAQHEPAYKKLEKRLDAAWREVPAWVGLY